MKTKNTLKYVSAGIVALALVASLIMGYQTTIIGVAYAQVPPPPNPFDIPLTVERSADRLSATAAWTPNRGAEYQAFFVVAKLFEGEPDTAGYGVKVDTFRYVDWPLTGDVGRLVITGLDSTRAYMYGVSSTARDSGGNWVWSQWEIVQDAASAPLAQNTPTATAIPTATPQPTASTTPTPAQTPEPTPTPTPTPAPWANWDRFTHADAGYSISVAPGWGRIGHGYWFGGGGELSARFAPLADGGDVSDVWVSIHNDDPPLTLTELVQRQRDEVMQEADDSSWQHFQVLSFEQKTEGGKSFYEFAYRRQTTDDTCVKRVVIRKFTSDHANKPYGFDARYRVCENRLNALEDTLDAMLDSFTETANWNPIAVPTPIPNRITGSGTLLPLGQGVLTDDKFAIRVNSTLPNPEVLYDDEPAPGRQFFLINITVQNLSNTRQSFSPYRFSAVGASAVEYQYSPFGSDGCGSVPGAFDSSRDLFSDGVLSGNICFSVRNSDINSLVLYLDPKSSNETEHWFDLGPSGGRDRYTNGVYRYRMNVAPGWIFDEDDTDPGYVEFHKYDEDGGLRAWISVGSWYLGFHSTLSEFANERRDSLRQAARDNDWEVFEITSFRKKTDRGREYYELVYRWQTDPEYCVSRRYARIMLSSQYPDGFAIDPDDKPYGYYLRSSICESSVNEYRGAVEAMMGNFGEWLR